MKKLLNLLTTTAYNSPAWKMGEDGAITLKDGNPVYTDTAGNEVVIELGAITTRNAEAKRNRERAEAAEKALKAFEGIDPEKAREALTKLGEIDLSKMVDSGKLDEVKKQLGETYGKQIAEKDAALSALQSDFDNMRIGSVFNNSDFVRNEIAVPREMFESFFRKNFKVDKGEVIAVDAKGDRILDGVDYATPEKALRILVNGHSQKDQILRADGGSGSGNSGNGGGSGQGRTMKRSEFSKLPPVKQQEFAKQVTEGKANLVD